MFVKTIVCFANSRKDGRRCVAGKTWDSRGRGAWVRPVSRDASRALKPTVLAYQNGEQLYPLDVVQIPFESHLPECHQRENTLVDEKYFWTKTGRLSWHDVDQWVDSPTLLLALNYQSTGMLNNRVPEGAPIGSSLQLIRVSTLQVRLVETPTITDPFRTAVVGDFSYHGVKYRLHVTDTEIENACRRTPGHSLEFMRPVLCISLGSNFRQYCYKLIACVMFERRFT